MSATLMLERRLWEPVEFYGGTEETSKIGKNFLVFQPSPLFVLALYHIFSLKNLLNFTLKYIGFVSLVILKMESK